MLNMHRYYIIRLKIDCRHDVVKNLQHFIILRGHRHLNIIYIHIFMLYSIYCPSSRQVECQLRFYFMRYRSNKVYDV